MIDFVEFLLKRVYNSKAIPETLINNAFKRTVLDVNYHKDGLDHNDIMQRIHSNENELALFLFRLGSEADLAGKEDLLPQIHWLLKDLCSCEIYFNNEIDEGFYIIHGEGTVIGSRNRIGKGFTIHHGCTIGHKKNGEGNGVDIGDDVTLYCNSSILGDISVGDNVIIGSNVLLSENVGKNEIVLSKSENSRKELN